MLHLFEKEQESISCKSKRTLIKPMDTYYVTYFYWLAWWYIFQWSLDPILPPWGKWAPWSRNWCHQFKLYCCFLLLQWDWLVSTKLPETLVFLKTLPLEVWGFTWSILTITGTCKYLNWIILKFCMEILKMAWVLFSFYSINLMIKWWWWWKAFTPSLHSLRPCHLLGN